MTMIVKGQRENLLWEAVKEPLRLLTLSIIPFGIAYFTELPYQWAGIVTLLLRGIDKFLHEREKMKPEKERLGWFGLRGLTNF